MKKLHKQKIKNETDQNKNFWILIEFLLEKNNLTE